MPNLAMNGGPKLVDRPIGSPWPVYDDREKQALTDVLESRKWGRSAYDYFNHEGSKLFEFEKQFAAFHDGSHALAVATGTTALEVCVRVAGVEAGCEVIVPACTYIASATAVMICNGVPVIVDVDPRNYTIDPKAVEAAVTPRTKAVMAVDFGGMPCDTDALGEICRKHGLTLISDCSHAHGGQWRGKGVGSYADIAAYSCMPGKVFAIGEGGVVMTQSETLYEEAFRYHHAGRDRGAVSRQFTWPATTLRMSEWEAAIGLVALTRLEEQAEVRWRNVRHLIDGMKEIPGIAGLEIDERVTRWNPFCWHFRFISDAFDGIHRDVFRKAISAEGVPCAIGPTEPIYRYETFTAGKWGQTDCPIRCPLYQGEMDYTKVCCPEAERIHDTEALLINHARLLGPKEDMDLILDAMRKVRANVDELRQVTA